MRRPSDRSYFTPSTIITLFYTNLSEKQIECFFEEHQIFGTRVGMVLNRYCVEVPFGKEDEFIDILADSDLVRNVNVNYLEGHRRRRRPKKEQNDYFVRANE